MVHNAYLDKIHNYNTQDILCRSKNTVSIKCRERLTSHNAKYLDTRDSGNNWTNCNYSLLVQYKRYAYVVKRVKL